MRKTRTCVSAMLNTGASKCPIDFEKIRGAIIVEHGQKLPSTLTATALMTMCHADRPGRALPILGFVEYAKAGGEVQTSSVGYGSMGVTGVSARTDTFTLERMNEQLNASLMKCMNHKFDVYYFDGDNVIYGVKDGDDLAGFTMSAVYPTVTPHPTSSAKADMKVNFAFEDAEEAFTNFDYVQADFNVKDSLVGLVEVLLASTSSNKYKIVEKIGGYDRTEEFGSILSTKATTVLVGATACSYANGELTITASGTPSLAAPSVLYANDITGIEQV